VLRAPLLPCVGEVEDPPWWSARRADEGAQAAPAPLASSSWPITRSPLTGASGCISTQLGVAVISNGFDRDCANRLVLAANAGR
jgi:hypothetical protein